MTKLSAHSVLTSLRDVKPRYIFAAAAVSGMVCLIGLRANNLHMVRLRAEVFQADKNNGDVRGSLTKLQHYVTSHMNTDLTPGKTTVYPPIQLQYTYERLVAANLKQTSNEQVYSDAQKYCEAQNPTDFSGRNRVPCISQYVASHGAGSASSVPDGLYKFDFVSPRWSPDLAGWTALLTILLVMAGAVSVAARKIRR